MRIGILGVTLAGVLVLSCSIPTLSRPATGGAQTGSSQTAAPTGGLRVLTDVSRSQGVLVTEEGATMDIAATDSDGTVVRCVAPLSVTILGDDGAGPEKPAIILGTVAGGAPAAWVYDGTKINDLLDEASGKARARLPESDEEDGVFTGRFGWTYHIQGVSEDGRIIAGYAENTRGFRHGRVRIDPGTTIGVYWRVRSEHHQPNRHYLIAHARIIGSFESSKPSRHGRGFVHRHIDRWMSLLLDRLKLALLDHLTSYLTMVDKGGVHYDAANGVYLISGYDENGDPAIATLDRQGRISIAPAPPQPTEVDLAPAALTAADSAVQGGSLTVTLAVQNLQSGATAGSFNVDFHLATSPSFAPSTDPTVGSTTVSSVGGNATVSVNGSLTIPQLGSNIDVYLYAVVDPAGASGDVNTANNVSTVAQAAIVLAYIVPTPAAGYPILVETYNPTGTESTNTGVILYRDNGDGTISYQGSDIVYSSAYFGALDYTGAGLGSGTYYLAVIPVASAGNYGLSVRTANIPHTTYLQGAGSDPSLLNNGTGTNGMNITLVNYGSYTAPVPTIAQRISVGGSLNLSVEAGTTDWFVFTLP